MQKPNIFSSEYAQALDRADSLGTVRLRYEMNHTDSNFALNSLGAPHCNALRYILIFMEHWKKYQVTGHFTPMEGIGNNPTGYAEFREMFRPFAIRMLGARYVNETAILNDQSSLYANILRWLLEKQIRSKRTIVLYEQTGVFPSDGPIIQETVEVINLNLGMIERNQPLVLAPIPQTKSGLIDHEKLLALIEETGEQLAVVAFGSGGVHWQTAQLLDMARIGPAVKKWVEKLW